MLVSDYPGALRASCRHDRGVCSRTVFTQIAAKLYILGRKLILELFIAVASENIKIFVKIQQNRVIGSQYISSRLIVFGRAFSHEANMPRDMVFAPLPVRLRDVGQRPCVRIKSVLFAHVL